MGMLVGVGSVGLSWLRWRIRGGWVVKIVRTVGDLRAFISGLDDGMFVVGVDSTEILVFVCDYDDLPDEDRPPPALVIES
jgi:hypothetical protein